jgi:hypothetical protein
MSEKKKRNSNECNVDLRWSPTQGIQHDHRHGQHGRYDRRGPTRTADSRTRSPRPSRHERCRLELGQKEVVGTLADAFHALPPIQSVCHGGGESNGENGERRTKRRDGTYNVRNVNVYTTRTARQERERA